jgi:hypothetical protein
MLAAAIWRDPCLLLQEAGIFSAQSYCLGVVRVRDKM